MSDPFRDLFVFEMANNHQGSVEHGRRIIDAVADIAERHGIRAAVKLQYRDLDSFIHPASRDREDVPHVPRFLSTRLSGAQFLTLIRHMREAGLLAVVTPFDERSVERCLDHGVDILKVASCSATDWPLLERVAGAGLPVVASTGGLSICDIDNLASFLRHRGVQHALMHCVSLYPTPNDQLQMNVLARMKRRYPGIAVGYSGHEAPENTDPVMVAIAKGADLLERHVGVPAEGIELNAYSMNPEQAESWVEAALRARAICGPTQDKAVGDTERDALLSLARGVYAMRPIARGEKIGADDVYFAMPCEDGQTTSGEFGRYRADWVASRNYAPDEAIRETAPHDGALEARRYLHEARGLLNEAGVAVGDDVRLELSHHYGLARFPDSGAVFVHVINREYCKKIGVMRAGQRHPLHVHGVKEETFQLLWGDLTVWHDEQETRLSPGDKLVIERGCWHAFASEGGAVFEEVSTTDHRGGSQYRDETINRLDPMQRKTFLESW